LNLARDIWSQPGIAINIRLTENNLSYRHLPFFLFLKNLIHMRTIGIPIMTSTAIAANLAQNIFPSLISGIYS
jgi:hypothetical protein